MASYLGHSLLASLGTTRSVAALLRVGCASNTRCARVTSPPGDSLTRRTIYSIPYGDTIDSAPRSLVPGGFLGGAEPPLSGVFKGRSPLTGPAARKSLQDFEVPLEFEAHFCFQLLNFKPSRLKSCFFWLALLRKKSFLEISWAMTHFLTFL